MTFLRSLSALAVLLACPAWACEREIANHEGGAIAVVAQEVAAERCHVRLSGVIVSSGTLWLGAKSVCIAPDVVMEFHGPKWNGFFPMAPVDFQIWSREIARHYPPPIARWYLATGRYGVFTIKAAELRRLGVAAC